jgi:hypothetical protein
MRHPEPEIVRLWRIMTGIPKCCHTCEHYDKDGVCTKFNAVPPREFAENLDACKDWSSEDGIPF